MLMLFWVIFFAVIFMILKDYFWFPVSAFVCFYGSVSGVEPDFVRLECCFLVFIFNYIS